MPERDLEGLPAEVRSERDAVHASEKLPLLYQGLLTGVVRLLARRQHISDAESFRRRTKTALKEVERDAIVAGYGSEDVRDTHFAVVAFLDEVVLNSNDPIRAEWERETLQHELFGKTDAGMVFFEKLDRFRSRRDSQQLADLLEVYLLCLLLGFEGRYSGGLRGELENITEGLKKRIESIRGSSRQISPEGTLPARAPVQEPIRLNSVYRLRLVTLAAVIITILCFLVLKWHTVGSAQEVREVLLAPML